MFEDKDKVTVKAGNSVGLGTLLAVLFIGLKLTGYITWSWWWVLSPLWIPLALVIGIILILVLIAMWLG
jgi:hypothetical protein